MPKKLEVNPLVKKFNEFVGQFSTEDQRNLYYILAGLRGPDSNDDADQELKTLYTTKLRTLLFPLSAHDLEIYGVMTNKNARLSMKEIYELAVRQHETTTPASDHFVWHLYKAICKIHNLDDTQITAQVTDDAVANMKRKRTLP